jgi:hypothetical protein
MKRSAGFQPESLILAVLPAAIAVALLWLAAHDSLGLWLGGMMVAAMLVPHLSIVRRAGRTDQPTLSALVVAITLALGWLIATLISEITWKQWLACSALLVVFCLSLAGFVRLFTLMRLPDLLAAGATLLMAAAWLGAPIWLSPVMNDTIAGILSRCHPILAINGQVSELGIWLQMPIAYRHTTLGQDWPYALPPTIWASLLAHGVLAAGCAVPASWMACSTVGNSPVSSSGASI